MTQSEQYSELHARRANLTLDALGLADWSRASVEALQRGLGLTGRDVDGWLGPQTIARWKEAQREQRTRLIAPLAARGCVVVNGVAIRPPCGVTVINYLEAGGVPADPLDVSPRTRPVTQFVLHRGAEDRLGLPTYAHATEHILDARGLSSTFSMDIDGTIYQHFDPAELRGRHASFHNVQSDSLDVGGPFSLKREGEPGQVATSFKCAIGRSKDPTPPHKRPMRTQRCWSLTPAQAEALRVFVPWWCQLRGIPARACSDLRCQRVYGLAERDPVTHVTGIVAHAQVGYPGARVDGFLPLLALEGVEGIEWREEFLT